MALQPVADPEDRAGVGATGVWNAVDTSPDLGGKNDPKPFEMATRYYKRPTLNYREFSVAGYIFSYVQNIFLGEGGGGITPIAPPPMDPPLIATSIAIKQLTDSTVNDAANAQIEDSKKGG